MDNIPTTPTPTSTKGKPDRRDKFSPVEEEPVLAESTSTDPYAHLNALISNSLNLPRSQKVKVRAIYNTLGVFMPTCEAEKYGFGKGTHPKPTGEDEPEVNVTQNTSQDNPSDDSPVDRQKLFLLPLTPQKPFPRRKPLQSTHIFTNTLFYSRGVRRKRGFSPSLSPRRRNTRRIPRTRHTQRQRLLLTPTTTHDR